VIAHEHKSVASIGVLVAGAPQVLWMLAAGMRIVQRDGLATEDSRGAIGGSRIDAMQGHARPGSSDEERTGFVQDMEAAKIDVAAIHDVKGSRFRNKQVEGMNVVQLSIGNVDEARDGSAQVEQRLHFYRRLRPPEVCPSHRFSR